MPKETSIWPLDNEGKGMLTIELEPGDSVRIGDVAVVTMREKSGRRARLEFEADRSIPIKRIQNKNTDAKMAATVGITGRPSENNNYLSTFPKAS